MTSNKALRKKHRQARRALSPLQQKRHAEAACRVTKRSQLFLQANRIVAFLATDGELNPAPLIEFALNCRKKIYLPVLHPFAGNTLWFSQYRTNEALTLNRYGIAEPSIASNPPASVRSLDLILLPLVAFSIHGDRLGMGGGYYDRTLARLGNGKIKPKLFGYAHECQKSDDIQVNEWDIPLDGVITEETIHYF